MIERLAQPTGTLITTDICIVGAGATGIAMAVTFAARGRDVVMLESGRESVTRERSNLNRAEWRGDLPDPPIHWARERVLGGSSSVWSGRIGELRPIDFEARPWIPHSGWPFGADTLRPYYDDARQLMGFRTTRAELDALAATLGDRTVSGDLRVEYVDQMATPNMATLHRSALETSDRIRVLLGTDAVGFEVSADAGTVKSVNAISDARTQFTVAAQHVILAGGGIENPRLLLESGLGNQHDLVGRFFSDRPYMNVGTIAMTPDLAELVGGDDPPAPHGLVTPSEELLRREQLASSAMYLKPGPALHSLQAAYGSKASMAIRQFSQGAGRREFPGMTGKKLVDALRAPGQIARTYLRPSSRSRPGIWGVRMAAEPTPNPDSRVMLSDRRDALGRRRPRVEWKLNELERRSLRRFGEIVQAEFERAGLPIPHLSSENGTHGWPASMRGGYHHMGTTRMHDNPRHGVVDSDCRVHGLTNLWLAGTSVFPSFGHVHPTLTAVALSLRLVNAIDTAG